MDLFLYVTRQKTAVRRRFQDTCVAFATRNPEPRRFPRHDWLSGAFMHVLKSTFDTRMFIRVRTPQFTLNRIEYVIERVSGRAGFDSLYAGRKQAERK
ncbi:MAG: hypothetical protein HGA47_07050 [Zoogloea sp.]|nr:hypothetical protein [Zoogloea sp.]